MCQENCTSAMDNERIAFDASYSIQLVYISLQFTLYAAGLSTQCLSDSGTLPPMST